MRLDYSTSVIKLRETPETLQHFFLQTGLLKCE